MNKSLLQKFVVCIILLLMGQQAFTQNYVPFSSRFDNDVKGDIVLIGNNILGPSNDPFNNNNVYNHNVDMQYIDIDGDPSTFSSSSADLEIPNPNCYDIIYAGLYWGAVTDGDAPITNVKLKGPTGPYIDINGTVIFEANGTSVDGGDSFPYACFADITSIITNFDTDLGTYTVANVSSAVGETSDFGNNTGYSSGWSLFIVFEDPTLPSKSITSFDGFSAISFANNDTVDVLIDGFRTIPAPAPVRANFAFATLEGDKPISGDRLKLNGTNLSTVDRTANNFFNSSVTQLSAMPVDNRNPNSSNTLGFDTGIIAVPNPGNTIIANDATSATVTLETGGDTYFPYFFAMAVEIIEPAIVLTKIVEDEFGNNIGDQIVGLGEELNYVIGFQNIGNDHTTNLSIRDILPINIVFDVNTGLTMPAGVTLTSYNEATRELLFAVEDYLVEENDPVLEIRIEATVVESCQQLANSCSNLIQNQAFATYQGTLNPTFIITDDPSISNNTGCLLSPQATNFLADLDDCIFSQEEILCGNDLTLTAADGYDSYSWSTSNTGTPVIGTTQSITVTETGTYYSFNTAVAPCQSIVQEFIVTLYGGDIPNPVIPFADEVVTCPNDGKLLPNIFLCGLQDFRNIQTDIDGAVSIIWEQLDEASCTPVPNTDCANENPSCTWNEVATGPNYTANTSGQFRLTINYQGGCFNQFYFNVYQNLLDPTVSVEDILCETPGSITVNDVPSGYEYSLDGITYQASNIFTITAPGLYNVYVRQTGVPSGACVFIVPDVLVRERDVTFSSIVEQPLCNGDKGTIYLAANDAEPQYFFSISMGGTIVNSVGPIVENNYSFANLNPGVYEATVETEDGCSFTEEITIIEPDILTVTASITRPLTCTDGEITIFPVGGTAPYFYFINSTTEFQTNPEVVITTAGVYDIIVVDSKNCSAETSITITATLPPEFTVSKTDILCASSGDTGTITFDVTNPNGNILEYSINGGFNFSNSPVFTGLAAGNYQAVVQYTTGNSSCLSPLELITIETNDPISGTAELESPFTCSDTGTITVIDVIGGTAPYTFSIDGVTFQNDATFPNLNPGTYSVIIKDANDCTFITNEIIIPALDPPVDLTFSNSPLTCPSNTVTVTITSTTGGLAPLEYQIIAPAGAATPYQTSTDFPGLAPGIYTFQVRDANDCVYSEAYAITELPAISIISETLDNVSCVGNLDGEVQFTVSGTTDFEYSINAGLFSVGTSPINLTGLGAGTYTIIVRDNTTNCEATASATVEEPLTPLTISSEVTPISCLSSGSAIITASGGWGGYTYTLTLPDSTTLPTQNSGIFNDLTQSGVYTITVLDSNGCSISETFTLTNPGAIDAEISITSDVCFDGTNGATIIVDVLAGEAPFEFSINGSPFQTANTFPNLIPGTYTITVRDALGCELTLPAQTIAPQLVVNAVLAKDLDCTISPNALIDGTIAGGSAPFTYSVAINNGGFNPLGVTGPTFTYNTANDGTYQFEITDALGCTALSPIITINPITLPAIDVVTQTQDILCNGDENGAIDITIDPTTGTAPFEINVFNTTTGVDYGTQTAGLPAGTYTITVTDANSCSANTTIAITQPDPIVVDYETIDITCTAGGVSQGSIIINSVTGGVSPYNYFVTGSNGYSESELNSTGSTSVTFNVIDFGLYEINVVDANGCSVLFQDVLIASPPTDLDIIIDSTVNCATGGQATVSVSSTLGSTGPFWFSIYQGPGSVYPNPPGSWIPENPAGSQSTTFDNLTPGVSYTFIVYDESSMCSYYEPATTPIPTNSTLTATAVSSDNITCTGSADGDVSFTINSIYGAPVDVTYEIFDSLSLMTTTITGTGTVPANGSLVVEDLGPLPFGTYYVLIEESVGPNAGCGVVTAPFSITESAILLSLTANVDENANCNPLSGVVSAVAQNGTAPYLYQINMNPIAPDATDLLWDTASVFNVNAGDYFVHALDAFGCIVTSPVQVVPLEDVPEISLTQLNECTSTEGNYEIEVALITAGIPPYSVSIDGGVFQSQTFPFTITNLSSGTHTVEVNDSFGCGNIATVNIAPPLAINPAVTAAPSCSNDDGEITVNVTGGSGNYSYSINPNPGTITLTGNVFSGVPSGTYVVTVTDTVTTCTADVSVTLDAATPVTFNTTETAPSCNGDSDGTITVNLLPGNDNPIYTYEITAPILVPAQNNPLFTGLAAGTYTIQVTSGRGCIEVMNATITDPLLLEVNGAATQFNCTSDNTTSTATVTITETGGTAPYTYSINGTNYFNSNTFEIADTGIVQTINIFAQDFNGCIATNTVTINPLAIISATAVVVATPIDCNETGTIAINVTGGSGNFSYQELPDGVPQVSNIFNITAPGTYFYQVNDLDTDCYFLTEPFIVAPFDLIDAVLTPLTDNDCFGNTIGELELTINGYTGAYTYQLLDGTGTAVGGPVAENTAVNPVTITGLASGNYSVEIVEIDTPFCTTTSNSATIGTPAVELSLDAFETANVTCNNNEGIITAIASGGTNPYEYELSGDATVAFSLDNVFDDLSAGTYTVTARDGNGCLASEIVTLLEPTPIDADFVPDTTMVPCFGDQTATITVMNVTGGQQSNYSYTLNSIDPSASPSGPQASNVFPGLGAGTYSVTITDGFGCIFTSVPVVIEEPDQIIASLVATTTPTCTIDGTLTLSADGGTGMYEYSDTETFANILGSFVTSVTFDVTEGTYTYYVRDANGCVANSSNEITIDPLPELTILLDSENPEINCVGDTTGTIVATAQGGLGNYVYVLQDTMGTTIPATQNSPGIFTELAAGVYVVYVESGDCNNISEEIEITQPDTALDVDFEKTNVICFGENNGRLEIFASGGTGIIKYAMSPQLNQFFTTNVFENLAPGVYDVIVQDELGCFEVFNFEITEPDQVLIAVVPDSIIPELCDGDINGSFNLEVQGGIPPYSVSLDDYNGVYITGAIDQTEFEFNNIGGGNHTVYVRDSVGCESEWVIPFPESVAINASIELINECFENQLNNTVSVLINENIDQSEIEYSLNDGPYQPSNEFSNLPPSTNNFITVRHINGCEVMTEFFDIETYDPVTLTLENNEVNEIEVIPNGGIAPYNITINGTDNGSETTFTISETGTYLVIVTDSNGCSASAEISLTFIELCIPNYFTPNNDGVADFWSPGCDNSYPNLRTSIFDRYGRKVAVLRRGENWDGLYDGKELPSGDYWYVIKTNEASESEFVGHFTLYR